MRERLQSDAFDWVDVHRNPEALQATGLELEDVRERLLLVAEGAQLRGFDAVVEAWSHLPRIGWMARPMRWIWVRHFGRITYNAFARLLYRWNRRRGNW